jgi:hypothetical protein
MLHRFNDGSGLYKMNARELITYQAWEGNRIIDSTHVKAIEDSLKGNYERLDFGFKLISIPDKDAAGNIIPKINIIDGQHRAEVLRNGFKNNPFMEDFVVLVSIKQVSNQTEAIAYFRELNHAKPIDWKDPTMIINDYIEALTKGFMQTKRMSFIRNDTKFPYLSDKILRTALEKENERVALSYNKDDISKFVEKVQEWNNSQITDPVSVSSKKAAERMEKAIGMGFVLAVDPTCAWIRACRI